LQVATRSANAARQTNAQAVLNEITSHSPNLVKQTQGVSEELIRIAILWHEQVCLPFASLLCSFFRSNFVSGHPTSLQADQDTDCLAECFILRVNVQMR
jgi:phosphatidylinositol kinase/protein kinase (PI-3  family)